MFGFDLVRDDDVAGVSGTGKVAQAVVFDDGTVALRWLTKRASTALYGSIADVIQHHGHGGKTRVVPHDGDTVLVCDRLGYGVEVCRIQRIPDLTPTFYRVERFRSDGRNDHDERRYHDRDEAVRAATEFLSVGAFDVGVGRPKIWHSEHQSCKWGAADEDEG